MYEGQPLPPESYSLPVLVDAYSLFKKHEFQGRLRKKGGGETAPTQVYE
jgi:hypothetical protein